MFYLFLPILIPVLVFFLLPFFATYCFHQPFSKNLTLFLACFFYFFSWYLPSPLIYGQNTSFTTHLVGGGFFSCLLALYCLQQLKIKLSPLSEFFLFFAATSSLGTINELFELFIVQAHLVKKLNIKDTSWDLLANTVGCLIFYLVFRILSQKKAIK